MVQVDLGQLLPPQQVDMSTMPNQTAPTWHVSMSERRMLVRSRASFAWAQVDAIHVKEAGYSVRRQIRSCCEGGDGQLFH